MDAVDDADRTALEVSPQPLLAQQLLLLSLADEVVGEPTPWIPLQCVVLGALVAELVDRGRVAVRLGARPADDALDVVDARPIGDDVLDQALHVLAGGHVDGRDDNVSLGLRVWGALARRRLRAGAKVRKRDLMRWWEGCWTCAEFPELERTLLCQVLRLYEELFAVHELLHERMGVDPDMPGFGVGLLRGRDVRVRLRAFALEGRESPDARMRYVVGLCGATRMDWLRSSLCSGSSELRAVWLRGDEAIRRDPIARVVALVADRWEAQFDG